MTSVAFVLAGLGVIFIWAAVRGEDPRDLFAEAFRPGSTAGKTVGKTPKTVGGAVGAGALRLGETVAKAQGIGQ